MRKGFLNLGPDRQLGRIPWPEGVGVTLYMLPEDVISLRERVIFFPSRCHSQEKSFTAYAQSPDMALFLFGTCFLVANVFGVFPRD